MQRAMHHRGRLLRAAIRPMIWTAHQRFFNITEQKDEATKTELDELLKPYALAVVEFNLASAPLIVALTAGVRPSAADIKREENARAAVVEARSPRG